MILANMPLSDNVVFSVCSEESRAMCASLPVINPHVPPSIVFCLWLFATTIAVAYWVDIYIYRRYEQNG